MNDYTNTSAAVGYLTPTSAVPTDDWDLTDQLNELIAGVAGLSGDLVRPSYQEQAAPIPSISTNWVAFAIGRTDPNPGSAYIEHFADQEPGSAAWFDSNSDSPPAGHDTLTDWEFLNVLVSFYGPNCERYARFFRDGLSIPQNWELAASRGMRLNDIGPIMAMPEQINDRWYRRADIMVRIKREISRDYNVLNVLSASGAVETDEPVDQPMTDFDTNRL